MGSGENLPHPHKNFFKKGIDKPQKVWYNISTVKERGVANDRKGKEESRKGQGNYAFA